MRGEEEHTECVGGDRGGRETGDDTVTMTKGLPAIACPQVHTWCGSLHTKFTLNREMEYARTRGQNNIPVQTFIDEFPAALLWG